MALTSLHPTTTPPTAITTKRYTTTTTGIDTTITSHSITRMTGSTRLHNRPKPYSPALHNPYSLACRGRYKRYPTAGTIGYSILLDILQSVQSRGTIAISATTYLHNRHYPTGRRRYNRARRHRWRCTIALAATTPPYKQHSPHSPTCTGLTTGTAAPNYRHSQHSPTALYRLY